MTKKNAKTPRKSSSKKADPSPNPQPPVSIGARGRAPEPNDTSQSREQQITDALVRLAGAEMDGPPPTSKLGLGSRNETVKVVVTVMRVDAGTDKIIQAFTRKSTQKWDDGPIKFGMDASAVFGNLARDVWGMNEEATSEGEGKPL